MNGGNYHAVEAPRTVAVTRIPPPVLVLPGLAGGIIGNLWLPTLSLEPAAAILSALGVIAIGWPLYLMDQAGTPAEPWKDTTHLLKDGPYRFSRNPIYVGFLLLQAGLPMWWGWWLPAALVPLSWFLLDRIVRKEEAYLAARFEDYGDYCARTRRWL